jgi:hypothetical protein
MSNHDEHKLDVDLEVIEEPEDDFFPSPREPNVISHRQHTVKITAVIRDVPEDTQQLTLQAKILTLGKETLGQEGHTSSTVETWGTSDSVTVPYPSELCETLPCKISLIVERSLRDDHLGEGPYRGLVDISTSNILDDTTGDGSEEQDDDLDGDFGNFMIAFVSK